jgi:hypothetical protein
LPVKTEIFGSGVGSPGLMPSQAVKKAKLVISKKARFIGDHVFVKEL